MALFNKFESFVEDLAEQVHNLGADQLVVALVAAATPPLPSNAQLSELVEIDYTNLSTRNIVTISSAQAGGSYRLTLADLVLTAGGGPVGPFRYVVIYNATSVGLRLVGWYDYGSDLTLASGETLTVDFDGTNGALQIN